MALLQCKECGSMISDQALTCPSCGCPTEFAKAKKLESEQKKRDSQKKSRRTIAIISLIIGLFGIVVCTFIWLPFEASQINFYEGGWSLFEEHLIVVYALLAGFGLFSYLLGRNESRKIKIITSSLFALYTISTVAYIAYYNVAIHKPHQEFLDKYQCADIAKNLQGAKFAWGKNIVISIEDNTIKFDGQDIKLSLQIDSVSDYGRIFAKCDVEKLKKGFRSQFDNYFMVKKVENMRINDPLSCFTISAFDYGSGYGFEIEYRGYYSERVTTGTRYMNSQFGMMAIPSTKQEWYYVSQVDNGYLQQIK